MKKGTVAFLVLFISSSLFLSAGPERWEFTLSPYGGYPAYGQAVPSSDGKGPRKKPLLAALEVFVINAGVWAYDRYALNKDYSHISWKTWKANLKSHWIWDSDSLGTGFFGHPYQGSMYFQSARSLGMTFWESIPYAAGGYLMWGYFMENDPPSYNDLIMTTLGGVGLGEVKYRLSAKLLEGLSDGGGGAWRRILAFALAPISNLNRWIRGGEARFSPGGGGPGPDVHGELSFGGSMISPKGNLAGAKFSPGVSYDIAYGVGRSEIRSGRPFELFFLNGEVRYAQKTAFLDIGTYGLLAGAEIGSSGPSRSVIGLFQNYDYFKSETMYLSGVALSAGLVSLFPLGRRSELITSLQLGFVPLGAARNPYLGVGDRDFNYDWGGMGKAEIWLRHLPIGSISVKAGRYQLYTIDAAAPVGTDKGHDFWTYVKADYRLPLAEHLGLRFDYGLYRLHQEFRIHPPAKTRLSRVGAALDVSF